MNSNIGTGIPANYFICKTPVAPNPLFSCTDFFSWVFRQAPAILLRQRCRKPIKYDYSLPLFLHLLVSIFKPKQAPLKL